MNANRRIRWIVFATLPLLAVLLLLAAYSNSFEHLEYRYYRLQYGMTPEQAKETLRSNRAVQYGEPYANRQVHVYLFGGTPASPDCQAALTFLDGRLVDMKLWTPSPQDVLEFSQMPHNKKHRDSFPRIHFKLQ